MSRMIDADALIDGYKHMGYDPSEHPEESYMEGWCKGFNSAVNHCIHHVIHAPTIESERKTGEWIIRDNPGTGWFRVTCSECGEDVTSVIPLIGFFPDCKALWNYCPDCGADMRGETE